MQDRNKHKKIRFPEFIRYRDDKMSGKERNSFERELQKDPFSKEASEGLSFLSAGEAEKDIADLHNKLKKRVINHQRLLFYRIAASVAVLMIVSSVFIIIEKNKSPEKIAANINKPESLEISESLPVTEPSVKRALPGQPLALTDKKKERSVSEQNKEESIQTMNASESISIADYQHIDSTPGVSVLPPKDHLMKEKIAVASPAMSGRKRSSLKQVEGKVVSSEDNMPVAGVSIVIKGTAAGVITDAEGKFKITLPDTGSHTLVANYIGMLPQEVKVSPDTSANIALNPSPINLSEVVVTGYGVARSEKADIQSSYISPAPAGGKSGFDRYIRENLRWPDSLHSGQKIVVVLDFLVRNNGSIDSIKIVKSPGKKFSDEAVRLIRSGPLWIPAEDNGHIVEDHARVRIVFK
jgi:TonB family protein